MERKDVQCLLRRIKNNYQDFITDDYTISEWYKELKDYDLEDVMNKLEQHFRSEKYGASIPKVYFLTKYLTKTKDKNKNINYLVNCPICGRAVQYNQFDNHYDKCSSIEFIIRNKKKYYNEDISRNSLEKLDNELFCKAYKIFCKNLYESGKLPKEELKNINKYLEVE